MHLKNLIDLKDARFIFEVLFKGDKTTRFIGGCVRDALLGRKVKDIDIGTTLHPDEVEKAFKAYPNLKVLDIGKQYGTVMVLLNNHSFEITTLRKDLKTDGRYAVVEYTDNWEEDAARRDFTINAMSYCPHENKLYDYFDGQSHLKSGLIKFIGYPHKRVEEDYLRILRLFRFYTYYGKEIDPNSLDACRKYSRNMRLLSQERKMAELYKILLHAKYLDTISLMGKIKILEYVSNMPEWNSGIQLCRALENLCCNYGQTLNLPLKIFAIFFKNNLQSSQIAKEFITLSKKEKTYLTGLSKLISSATLSAVTEKPHYYYYYYREVLTDGFLYLQAKSSSENIKKFSEIVNLAKQDIPEFPLTGLDLMSYCALKPGKKLGKFLNMGKEFWIQSKFTAKKEIILSFIKKYTLEN